MKGGALALQDYELIELILFRAIPRRDVKPLAKNIIERFGSYGDALSASPERLREIKGLGEAAITEIKIVHGAAERLAQSRVLEKTAIGSWDALIEYCQTSMAYRDTEQFRILFLDRQNKLIADEAQQQGTVDHTPVYPREVVKRALELGATALILVHNHPSGDPTPSGSDVEMTKSIVKAAEAVGVSIHDHLVIGRGRHTSFRSQGLL
jgi:DNA repair protein RadC